MAGVHGGHHDGVLVTQEIAPLSNQATNANGAGVDMKGWDGVAFVLNLGVFTGSAVCDARVVEGALANMTNMTNVTNLSLTQVPSGNANNVFILDYYNPTQRYVKLCAVPTVNGVFMSATAVRYKRNGLALPPTQATGGQHVKVAN